jgi:hypothetical protein
MLKAKTPKMALMRDRSKPFLIEKKFVQCRLGIHSWGEPHVYELISKDVEGWEKRCLKCDAVHRWTKHTSLVYKGFKE